MNCRLVCVFTLFTLYVPALWSQTKKDIPVEIIGGDARSLTPEIDPKQADPAKAEKYDVIVVGGGLSGLTAALYLSDAKQKVLVLEKEPTFGGLAAYGKDDNGKFFDRGAAYWTGAYEEEAKILERFGLANFQEKYAIREPIDSYLWNGELYEDVWGSEKTLAKLPQSFPLFKHALKKLENEIPNQPIEEEDFTQKFDQLSGAEWMESLVAKYAKSADPDAKKLYLAFKKDAKRINFKDRSGMGELLDFMNLFCRSALGSTCDEVSAVAFLNFYISEIDTRYTSLQGTGIAAKKILDELVKSKRVTLKTSAPVGRIVASEQDTEVFYLDLGEKTTKLAVAKYVVYAAPFTSMNKLIAGFGDKIGRKHKKALDEIRFSDYTVHATLVKGHPYRKSYDTWVRAKDATPDDFTDLVLGRWVDPEIDGYEGTRAFEKDPAGDGIMTVYHPHPKGFVKKNYSDDETKTFAFSAIERMQELFSPLSGPNKKAEKERIEVKKIWTSRWPFSIHVVKPGYFTKVAPILRQPLGRIYPAHSNIGTPAFEEALFRGHCAANQILKAIDSAFRNEAWSRCPLD